MTTKQDDTELLPARRGQGEGPEAGAVHADATPGSGHGGLLCGGYGQDRPHLVAGQSVTLMNLREDVF